MRVAFQLLTTLALAWIAAPALAADTHSNVDACFHKRGEEAIAGCTALIQSGSKSGIVLALAYISRGGLYGKQNDYASAIADFTAATRLRPRDPYSFYHRGNIYRLQKDYQRAIADFDEAIQHDPKYAQALYGRGLAKAALRQSVEAKADIARARAIDPQIEQKFK